MHFSLRLRSGQINMLIKLKHFAYRVVKDPRVENHDGIYDWSKLLLLKSLQNVQSHAKDYKDIEPYFLTVIKLILTDR